VPGGLVHARTPLTGVDAALTTPDFARVSSPEAVMAVLLLLLAIIGAVLVGDLVVETPPLAVSPCCSTR
jgi:hypothetical protein